MTAPADRDAIRKDLRAFLGHGATGGYPAASVVEALYAWLDYSTDEQIRELSKALAIVRDSHTSTDSKLLREAAVITAILQENFDIRDHLHRVHDLLSSRSAFCSDWAITANPSTAFILPLYLGFFGAHYGVASMPEYRSLSHEQMVAALRYAYEMIFASYTGTSNSPVVEIYVENPRLVASRFSVLMYRDPQMLELVAENVDRVGKIISLARNNDTDDPARLAVLLEYDGPSSLSNGWL